MYTNSFINPYMYSTNTIAGKSLFSKLFSKFSFSGFLSGASKTLNVVNQAIPIYYQVKPMINNAKTMFKVMNIVKTPDNKDNINKNKNKTVIKNTVKQNYNYENNPTFFI